MAICGLPLRPTTADRGTSSKRVWPTAIPMSWPMWKQSARATAAKYPRKLAAKALQRQEETDVNHFRLIAAILISIALGAGDVFAQQSNIHDVSSQQVDPT